MTLISIILFATKYQSELAITKIFQAVSLSLLLVLLIFDYVQKPTFFELFRDKNNLIMKLFIPDTRYYLFFLEKRVKTLTIHEKERIELTHEDAPLKKSRLGFLIKKQDGTVLETEKLGFSWASAGQMQILNLMISEHNKKAINT